MELLWVRCPVCLRAVALISDPATDPDAVNAGARLVGTRVASHDGRNGRPCDGTGDAVIVGRGFTVALD